MTTTSQQPPSSRDFEVYQAVHVERRSTREVASVHDISQTRVRQLVTRVAQWLSIVLPQADIAQENESRLAQHITADQLHFVNQELMECWRASHNTKFLGQTIRVSLALARLGVVPGMIGGLMADAEEGLLEEHVESPKIESESPSKPSTFDIRPSTPPAGDCSQGNKNENTSGEACATPAAAKPQTETPCAASSPAVAAARRNFLAPLRTLLSDSESPAVAELRVTRSGVKLDQQRAIRPDALAPTPPVATGCSPLRAH